MPYESIKAAKEAGFPTTADGAPLTLAQINKLASIYDAVKAEGTAENAMAIAWTQWKALYVKEEDVWVLRKGKSAEAMIAEDPNKFRFDVSIQNNKGNFIKVRDTWIYLDSDEVRNDQIIKERLASEMAYDGVGSYDVYVHNPLLRVGDEVPENTNPIYTISISVTGKSAVFMSTFTNNSQWIPVAAVNQKTTLEDGKTITLSKESLESNLESWKGGYINVNHEDNGEIYGLKIEDAKFENELLQFKVSKKLAEFIQNTASSGRSIEINNMDIVKDVVMSYSGLGLAVLYPPYTPACTTDMGCSSIEDDGWKPVTTSKNEILSDDTDNPSAIRAIFTKLADKLKSQSFMDSMIENSGTDPNLEKTMTEETDTLKFAKMEAEKSRDEAKEEVKTLKFSLVEKDTALKEKDGIISDKDTLITEQTERLKFYADAEVAAAAKLKEDQWDTLKTSIPPGKFHKPEDEAALKKEFFDDPAAFTIKFAAMDRVAPQGESGAEFTGDQATQEATDMAVAERLGA